MATVGRLAGALLAVTENVTYLIGELKEPLHYSEAGYQDPGERDIKVRPITVLKPLSKAEDGLGEVVPGLPRGDCFQTALEGTPLADLLAHFFLIRRNGIVSERLWRLVIESSPSVTAPGVRPHLADAAWLAQTPWPVWEAVRDAVLRC